MTLFHSVTEGPLGVKDRSMGQKERVEGCHPVGWEREWQGGYTGALGEGALAGLSLPARTGGCGEQGHNDGPGASQPGKPRARENTPRAVYPGEGRRRGAAEGGSPVRSAHPVGVFRWSEQ